MVRRAGVVLWRVDLDAPRSVARRCMRWLDREERRRAARLPTVRERARFVVAHGALREILAAWLRCPPVALRFVRGAYGKPALARPRRGRRLHFNLSHSEALALVAVTRAGPVGVDVEYWRRAVEVERLARRVFSAAEYAELAAVPVSRRREAFFLGWTRKEACVKSLGTGIFHGLGGLHVTLTPGGAVALRGPAPGRFRWRLYDLTVHPGYKAALASRSGPVPYRWKRWRPPLSGRPSRRWGSRARSPRTCSCAPARTRWPRR